MSTNDITGDALRTKPASDAYRSGYDAIFRKEDQIEGWPILEEEPNLIDLPDDETRIDIIGQNGNTAEHYEVK